MSTWDYEQDAQIADELHHALKSGMCHLCLNRKANGNKPCDRCQDEMDKATEDTDMHDAKDYYAKRAREERAREEQTRERR